MFNGYLKEGPGVPKNGKKKKGLFYFLEVLWAKLFKLIGSGVMYFLVSLPVLAIYLFVLAPVISGGMGLDSVFENTQDPNAAKVMFHVIIACGVFNFFGAGPASAGYAFVTRCFTRREHTWILSDGLDKMKENFKNSILLLITDIVVLYATMTAAHIYSFMMVNGTQEMQMLITLMKYLLYVCVAVYMMAHIFAYQLMVTYECKFKDIIKNSLILAMAKLPMCVLLTIITGVIFMLVTNFSLLAIVLYAVVGITLARFPLEFYAARVIEKNIRMTEKKEAKKREKENAAIGERVEA